MSRAARLWREHRLLAAGFGLAVLLAVAFGARTVVFWVRWSDPARHEQALEGWMTPGYVARSWGVDRAMVAGALGIEPGDMRGRTLAEIAAARGVPLATLEADLASALQAALAAARDAP